MFLILVGLLTWMMLISVIGIISSLINHVESFDLFLSIVFITIFAFLVLGITAVVKQFPPFHYLIIIAAGMNFVISFPGLDKSPEYSFIHFPVSLLIIYLGLRFPIPMDIEKSLLK